MALSKKTAQTANLQQGAAHGFQPCVLTWYDPAQGGTNSASGKPDPHSATASGEPYDPNKDTCAAPPNYAFGTEITFYYSGTTVICRVNDRGGAITGNHFDLSRGAAQKIGMISAGKVNAQFQVGKVIGGPTTPGGPSAAPKGTSGSPLQILSDILTGDVGDLATILADAAVNVIKDIGLGFADWIVIPWWHWNQRAVQFYLSEELFANDESHWTVIPWTAAFWGLGYWLLFTDPNGKSLKPAPVRNSRMAHHVRRLQSIPARRALVKPKDVKEKTPTKPNPVQSRALVVQTGTMSATRPSPVRVTGTHVDRENNRSEIPIKRERTLPGEKDKLSQTSTGVPNQKHRTRDDSPSNSGRDSYRGTNPRKGTDGGRT